MSRIAVLLILAVVGFTSRATENPGANWSVEKKADSKWVAPGGSVRFTLIVKRLGPPVTGVTVWDYRTQKPGPTLTDIQPPPTFNNEFVTKWADLSFNTGDTFVATYNANVGPDFPAGMKISNYLYVMGADHISVDVTVGTKPVNLTRGGAKPAKTEPPEPVSAGTGEYFIEPVTDLAIDGPLPLALGRFCGSLLAEDAGQAGSLSPGWMHSFEYRILNPSAREIAILYEQGKVLDFWIVYKDTPGLTGYELNYHQEPVKYELQKDDGGSFWLMDPRLERVLRFDPQGRLADLFDRNGNRLTAQRDGNGRLLQVSDGLGRTLTFGYTPEGLLAEVGDGTRSVCYSYDGSGRLSQVTDLAGGVTRYAYDPASPAPLITAITLPEGNVPYTQEYDAQGRVAKQTDAYGNEVALDYDTPGAGQTRITDAYGSQVARHADARLHTANLNRDGTQTATAFDDRERQAAVTDAQGQQIAFTYDEASRKVASVRNPLGDTISLTYEPRVQSFSVPGGRANPVAFTFHDLSRADYPDGRSESFARDGRGNILTYTDRDGAAWTYEVDSRGQVTKSVNPTGGETLMTYSPAGALMTVTEPDGFTTEFLYDNLFQVTRINYPGGAFSQIEHDAAGRITRLTDQLGSVFRYEFDKNGNLTGEFDPAGQKTAYGYDLMGRLASLTNRSGGRTEFTYDAMGVLASAKDPSGYSRTFQSLDNGRRILITDEAGHTWEKVYDAEGLLTSTKTPMGRTTSYERDALGRTVKVTDPAGSVTAYADDAAGLLASVTGPLGHEASFTYTGKGLLASASRTGMGTSTYTRNSLGLPAAVTDPGGSAWGYTYTPMGREASHTDPLGHTWTYAHDAQGFRTVTHPNGDTMEADYDAAGNLVRASWSDGTDIGFAYDGSYQMTSTSGLQFGHGTGGMLTETVQDGLSFTARYDLQERLAEVGYAGGLLTVSYGYNARGDLAWVADTLTGSRMDLDYDPDGRLATIHRSNGVQTHYTRDAASRVTGVTDGAFAEQRYEYDAAGRIVRAEVDLPLEPSAALGQPWEDAFSYNAASQVSSPGYGYDARGRRTLQPGTTIAWDGAERLTGLGGIAFTYDGLGGIIDRTEQSVTVRHYSNYALGWLPSAASRDATTGDWRRFYIWGPQPGHLLYAIERVGDAWSPRFYHFDPRGDTLFVTDGAGAVTDAYAYDPYGASLGHQGASTQPYTYQGQFGTRWDGDAEIYQMGARWYDPATAAFLSRDPLWNASGDPFSLNPYQYANQNPLKFIDPTGMGALGILYSGISQTEGTPQDEQCPIPCKGICQKVEVQKVMIVLGTDSGALATPSYLRKSYRWAKEYLEKKCGKENVVALRNPTWDDLKTKLAAVKNDLSTFVFIGHGDSGGGVDLADKLVRPDADFLGSAMNGSTIPDVFFFACYQGSKENVEKYANTFHFRNFYGPTRLLSAMYSYYTYLNNVKKITCQKTWKWICIEKSRVPTPEKTPADRVVTHTGKKATAVEKVQTRPK